MSKTHEKLLLIKTQPRCPLCGCAMVVSDGNPRNPYSHEAVLKESRLLCLGCHRRKCKVAALEKLPRWPRWKKKFDNATGLISRYRRVRKRVKKLLYLWQGGKLTGKSQFVN